MTVARHPMTDADDVEPAQASSSSPTNVEPFAGTYTMICVRFPNEIWAAECDATPLNPISIMSTLLFQRLISPSAMVGGEHGE